jgi:hypothetical protein
MIPALHINISRRGDEDLNFFAAEETEDKDARSHCRNVMFAFGREDLISLITAAAREESRPLK